MPNWCANTLEVSSPDAQVIEAFREQANAEGSALSLNNFLATPQRLLDMVSGSPPQDPSKRREYDHVRADNIAEYGEPSWYEWNNRNWGTKWDVDAVLKESRQHFLEYVFDSAWTPPIAWLRYVSARFPDAIFHLSFCDPALSFIGTALAIAGVVDESFAIDSDQSYDGDDSSGDGEESV